MDVSRNFIVKQNFVLLKSCKANYTLYFPEVPRKYRLNHEVSTENNNGKS